MVLLNAARVLVRIVIVVMIVAMSDGMTAEKIGMKIASRSHSLSVKGR